MNRYQWRQVTQASFGECVKAIEAATRTAQRAAQAQGKRLTRAQYRNIAKAHTHMLRYVPDERGNV